VSAKYDSRLPGRAKPWLSSEHGAQVTAIDPAAIVAMIGPKSCLRYARFVGALADWRYAADLLDARDRRARQQVLCGLPSGEDRLRAGPGWLAACCRISTMAEGVNRLPAGPDLASEMLAQAPIGSWAFLAAVRSSRVPLLAERVLVRVCKGLGMTAI
jgi:hypothetical protein